MPIPEKVRSRKFYFSADELSAEARQYLAKMLTVQLQSEYGDAPDRSGAVCPTVEDKTWLDLQLSQEKEHGLGVSEMLQSLGVDPTEYIKEAEASVTEGSRKLDYFRMRMEDGVERTLTRVLAERTGAIQTVAGMGTWFVPLALWHAKNYGDEALGHTVQGVRYTQRLMAEGRAEECQRAADKFYPRCLDIFGGVGTPNERQYLELGIKNLTNNQTRQLWIRSLKRDLDLLGLRLPADAWQGDRHRYPPEPEAALQVYLDTDEVPAETRPWLVKLLRGWVQAKYARAERSHRFLGADAAGEDGHRAPVARRASARAVRGAVPARAGRRPEPDRRRGRAYASGRALQGRLPAAAARRRLGGDLPAADALGAGESAEQPGLLR